MAGFLLGVIYLMVLRRKLLVGHGEQPDGVNQTQDGRDIRPEKEQVPDAALSLR